MPWSHLASLPFSIRCGIERETLRATPRGQLALTPHPRELGSKLTHPFITTDFCEAQIELITPVATSVNDSLQTLAAIHQFVWSQLQDEVLWPSSMPCDLPADDRIPLAEYGVSNSGLAKHTYRNGLGLRYGRSMQTICAVHYNVSFGEDFFESLAKIEGKDNTAAYRSGRYFDLMRNFRRVSWLVVYLFGASPAVANSFVLGRAHNFSTLDDSTLYLPYATSLRSGGLGYQSDVQASQLQVCYNSLQDYVDEIARGITTPWPPYARPNGTVAAQLNENILQSEAEFYSSIRAKRVPRDNEPGLQAIQRDGVEYIEVRLLDVDPESPIGVSESTLAFMNTLLTWCLLSESPRHNELLCTEVGTNLARTVVEGRIPDFKLQDNGKERRLQEWGFSILTQMAPIANWIDGDTPGFATRSLAEQQAKVADPDNTPSARQLARLKETGQSLTSYCLALAENHHRELGSNPMSSSDTSYYASLADESHAGQAAVEARPQGPFDEHLADVNRAYLNLRTRT